MTGQAFGRWTVINQAGNAKRGGAIWLCQCSCGTRRGVMGADLRAGKSISCGCHRDEIAGARFRRHNETGSRLYHCWQNMRRRCSDAGDSRYGARGIAVCPEWLTYEAFREWAMAAGYKDGLSIERIDVNGNYEPANCTWTTPLMQSNNRRFVKRASNGIPGPLLARQNGIPPLRYAWRVNNGWSVDQAATWPLGVRRTKRARNSKGQFC